VKSPLEVGGVDDYGVKLGSMLLTMVDPNRGFEQAYNRWYERDHYYAGCLVGPWLFAGSRWVAPRALREVRWPRREVGERGEVARPWHAGCYVAIYWVERGHHADHFDDWARPQVRWLYGEGRGFAERRHIHTVLFDHLGAVYREADPVPVELALDAGYDGLVVAWFDGRDGLAAAGLHAALSAEYVPELLAGSTIESVSSWTPSAGENDPKDVPMDLGSPAGGPERLLQLCFVRGDVRDMLHRLRAYTDRVEAAGLADTRLVAPFLRTVVGTDRYVDELW
jgi:hypothetical protein